MNEHEGLRVDIGCGTTKKEGYYGIDISEESNADEIHDVRKGMPFCTSSVDEVRAYSMLEHFTNDDFIQLMWEIWRVLKNGGKCDFEVPHGLSEAAVKDPTHRMHFSPKTFVYFKKGELRQKQYSLPPFKNIETVRDGDTLYTTMEADKDE